MNRPEPLDPESPKGRKVAADLSFVMTNIRRPIPTAEAREAVHAGERLPVRLLGGPQ
jgi:hypothetical protein